jgi:hypothetical protein
MERNSQFIISFEGVSVGEANRLAQDLENELKRNSVHVSRGREDVSSQDFGGTLIMLLGTPAVVAVAHALHAWAVRKNASALRIESGDHKLIAKDIESKDAARLVEAFAQHFAEIK